MKKEIELKENILAYDRAICELKEIKQDITPIFNRLCKALGIVILVVLSFLIICALPLLSHPPVYERVLYASIGILTFISIFYSLLVSPSGRDIFDTIEKLIASKGQQIKGLAVEKIKKSKGIEEMNTEITKIEKELDKMSLVKSMIDVESLLLIAVICLLISIILALFHHAGLYIVAYLLFSIGISYSSAIVVEWRVLRKISDELKEGKYE